MSHVVDSIKLVYIHPYEIYPTITKPGCLGSGSYEIRDLLKVHPTVCIDKK